MDIEYDNNRKSGKEFIEDDPTEELDEQSSDSPADYLPSDFIEDIAKRTMECWLDLHGEKLFALGVSKHLAKEASKKGKLPSRS